MLKFIKEILVLPEFTSWIALSAMVISALSYVWTRKAAKTSQSALEHAKAEVKKNALLEAEKKRFELLCAISNEKALLMEARLELGALNAQHSADHEAVKALLQNYSQVFDYLPQVESSIAQLDALYDQVTNTDPVNGSAYFLKLAAEQNRISKDTEYFKKCCDGCLTTFQEKREKAVEYHQTGHSRQIVPNQSINRTGNSRVLKRWAIHWPAGYFIVRRHRESLLWMTKYKH